MAAIFKIKNDEFDFDKTWHIGFDPAFSKEEIKHIKSVQIDGDEASFLYDFDLDLTGKRVHQLGGNEAKLYYLLIKSLYGDRPKYQNEEGKIDNYFSGLDHPEQN